MLATGCSSTGETRTLPQIPFHLAVVPLEPLQAPVRGTEGEHTLQLDGRKLSAELARALSGSFARVTLLEPPPRSGPFDDPPWVGAARAAGADILLDCDMRYDAGFVGRRNGKFWPNLFLFLLGGPACYFVNDRTYSTDAALIGEFSDLNLVYRDLYDLDSGRVRLISVNADFDRVSMDFVDRAGGHVPSYLVSLFVPAGLLAKSNTRVKHGLERKMIGELCDEFARRVGQRRRDLVEAEDLVSFWFEPSDEQYTVMRDDVDTVRIRGRVILRVDEEVRRMSGWRVRAGREPENAEPWQAFGEAVSTTRRIPGGEFTLLEYPLEATLAGLGSARTVCLELEDGHENRNTRRYTFLIREDQGEVGRTAP